MVEQTGGPGSRVGAWLAVFVIVAGFITGMFAVIFDNNVVIWIIAGVVLVLGGVIALASNIMEQAE